MKFEWPAWIFYLQGLLFLLAAGYTMKSGGSVQSVLLWAGTGVLGLIFGTVRKVQERRAAGGTGEHG
jgi:hypothetical protein